MRKLILKMDLSLDGFCQGINGESDWIFDTCDEGCTKWEVEGIWQAGLHVMGRKTFEDMASYWPGATNPFAAPMNAISKLVFTRSGTIDFDVIDRKTAALASKPNADDSKKNFPRASAEETKRNQASWRDPIIGTDLASEIARQKGWAGKDLIAYGGASFARDLIKHDLIDEYRLVVHPVALGKGLPIFDGIDRIRSLQLVSSTTFPAGATAHIFTRRR